MEARQLSHQDVTGVYLKHNQLSGTLTEPGVTVAFDNGADGSLRIVKHFPEGYMLTDEELNGISFTVFAPDGSILATDKEGNNIGKNPRTLAEFPERDAEGNHVWTINNLEPGVYRVVETPYKTSDSWNVGDESDIVTYETAGEASTDGSITVPENNTAERIIQNAYLSINWTATLQAHKALAGDAEAYEGDEEFSFVLTKADGSTSNTDMLPSSTTATAKVGETATFGNIGYAEAGTYYYNITEQAPEEPTPGMTYDTTAKWAKVVVDPNAEEAVKVTYGASKEEVDSEDAADELTVSNPYTKRGNLEIRKAFEGIEPSDELKEAITFTVTGPNEFEETKKLAEFTEDESGNAVWRLNDIVPGEYTVTETNAEVPGYLLMTTYAVGDEANEGTCTVDAYATTNMIVTNTYAPNTGKLEIHKEVVSTVAADFSKDFAFMLTTDNEQINGIYGDLEFVNGIAAFTLKAGETKTAVNLPLDEEGKLAYVLEETDNGGLEPSHDVVTTDEDKTHIVTFTNTRNEPGSAILRVQKRVSGEGYKGDEDFKFQLAKADGSTATSDVLPEQTEVTAKAGGTASFGAITYSEPGTYYYTITEQEPETKTEGMSYDTAAHYVKVVVDENLKATVTYDATNDKAEAEEESVDEEGAKAQADEESGDEEYEDYDTESVDDESGDEEGTDDESGDEESGDEEGTDDESDDEETTDDESGDEETTDESGEEGTDEATGGEAADEAMGEEATDDKSGDVLIVTNYYYLPKPGQLTVVKRVSSTRSEDKTKAYGFKVTLYADNARKTPLALSGTYGDMEFKNGVAEFTLKADESKTATGLPMNADGMLPFTYEETDKGGLSESWSRNATDDGMSIVATCTNTYVPPTTTTSNPPKGTVTTTTTKTSTPKTGDPTMIVAPLAIAVTGVTAVVLGRRRRRK